VKCPKCEQPVQSVRLSTIRAETAPLGPAHGVNVYSCPNCQTILGVAPTPPSTAPSKML
jgi:uncharacterized protein with PIN domain